MTPRERTGPRRRESFREEALPHLHTVYRFALRLAGSPAAAEDLVQETFFRAWRSWEQYTPGTKCKSWLFTICRNAFLRGEKGWPTRRWRSSWTCPSGP